MANPWNNKRTIVNAIIIVLILLVLVFISSDMIGEFKMSALPLDKEKTIKTYSLEEWQNFEKQLTKLQKDVKEKGGLWQADYTSKSMLTDEEKKKLCGLKISDEPLLKDIKRPIFTSSEPLPDFFDWRDYHGKDYITPVKDQGHCGSCWAFAAVATLEGAINAYYNNPGLDKDLSEQDLISCFHGSGCDGASYSQIKDIFSNYYVNNGIATEGCFPYTATNDDCDNKCTNWQETAWKTQAYVAPELTPDDLKRTLIEYGPIEVGMAVYADFFYYKSGIYTPTSNYLVGYHAVTIVGFGKYDGINYWIVKNSWGSDWGENGYFKIPFGVCDIDKRFAFAIDKPISPNNDKVICADNDNDGYCYWGLGERPETCPVTKPSKEPIIQGKVVDYQQVGCCPASCKAGKDCDDSDPDIVACVDIVQPTGFLDINSNPTGANVFIKDINTGNWVYRGKTPLNIELNTGEREIKLTKVYYLDKTINVTIMSQNTTYLNLTLSLGPRLFFPYNPIFRAGDVIQILGTASADDFDHFELNYKTYQGNEWSKEHITLIDDGTKPIINGTLGYWNTSFIKENDYYLIELVVYKNDGTKTYAFSNSLYIDPSLKKGWPIHIEWYNPSWFSKSINLSDNAKLTNLSGTNSNLTSYYRVLMIEEENGKSVIKTLETNKTDEYRYLNLDHFKSPPYYLFGPGEPEIVDIDGDGLKEMFIYGDGGGPTKIYGFKSDGTPLEGWPVRVDYVYLHGENLGSPSIADLDHDGYGEIIVNGEHSLYIYNHNGSVWKIITYNHNGDFTFGTPTNTIIEDINNDGSFELIRKFYGSDGSMKGNQVIVMDLSGNVFSGWPKLTYNISYNETHSYKCSALGIGSSPAVGNLDDDNEKEIIVGDIRNVFDDLLDPDNTWHCEGIVYAFNLDGSNVPGFPVKIGGKIFSSPAVVDINNDGYDEIIVGTYPSLVNNSGLYVIDRHGRIIPGWPQLTGQEILASPAFADFDGDKNMEIAIFSTTSLKKNVYLFNITGHIISGWPQRIYGESYTSPITADVDNDGMIDVLVSAGSGFDPQYPGIYSGGVYAWNFDGSLLYGYPKVIGNVCTQPAPTVADLDNDGIMELIAVSDCNSAISENFELVPVNSIYVWEIGPYNDRHPWPEFHHDIRSTSHIPTPCSSEIGHDECLNDYGKGFGEYCYDGRIIYNCQKCGCTSGYICKTDGSCVKATKQEQIPFRK